MHLQKTKKKRVKAKTKNQKNTHKNKLLVI